METPEKPRRAALLFSGGPAPGANAVISAAAMALHNDGFEVLGITHGYSNLQDYSADSPLERDVHYRIFSSADFSDLRNARGVVLGTSRAGPGAMLNSEADLLDPAHNQKLDQVYQALVSLDVDALISIGGDGTLRTANLLHRYQALALEDDAKRIAVVHVPKTIDNDYKGIDFTFGYFTAVDVMASELLNLRADCISTSSYFIVETMGRSAGWLSYGVAIAGEANLVLAPEDVDDSLMHEGRLSVDKLTDRIVDLVIHREERGKHYGTVVLAEGLAEFFPPDLLADVPVDHKGNLTLGKLDLGRMFAQAAADRYLERTGRRKKMTGIQLGYESRSARPNAYDVMLGSQLGIGAYRAVKEGRAGHLVSVSGQLDLKYIPFDTLMSDGLSPELRKLTPGSDFHRLARFMEKRQDNATEWTLSRRKETPGE